MRDSVADAYKPNCFLSISRRSCTHLRDLPAFIMQQRQKSIDSVALNVDDDPLVQKVKEAIAHGVQPERIVQGSSGSYFAKNVQGEVCEILFGRWVGEGGRGERGGGKGEGLIGAKRLQIS